NEHWRTRLSLNRAHDRNYLRNTNLFEPQGDDLRSQAVVEGFYGTDYLGLSTAYYQDLRPNTNRADAYVLPKITYSARSLKDGIGGRWHWQANASAFSPSYKTSAQRIAADAGYRLNQRSTLGYEWDVNANLALRYFRDNTSSRTGVRGRNIRTNFLALPQLTTELRVPFIKSDEAGQAILQPLLRVRINPNRPDNAKNINTDSVNLPFDDVSIFSSRISGNDVQDDGVVIGYGAQYIRNNNDGTMIDITAGQEYRLSENDILNNNLSINGGASDFFTATQWHAGDWRLTHKLYFDEDNATLNRYIADVAYNHGPFDMNIGVRALPHDPVPASRDVNDLYVQAGYQISNAWRTNLHGLIDTDKGETRHWNFAAVYEDECLRFTSTLYRTLTRSAGSPEDTGLLFQIDLKTVFSNSFSAGSLLP
ncbi:MAG: hypothetical protein AAF352_03715, partial [Pseudomonadota bacterium]